MIGKQQIKSEQISIYFTGYIKELPVDEEKNTIKHVFQTKRQIRGIHYIRVPKVEKYITYRYKYMVLR
jgi:hypothetical protein